MCFKDAEARADMRRIRGFLAWCRLYFVYIVLAVFALISATVGYVVYSQLSNEVLHGLEQEDQFVTDLTARRIETWKRNRLLEAKVLADDPFLSAAIHSWLNDPTHTTNVILQTYFEHVADSLGDTRIGIIDKLGHPYGLVGNVDLDHSGILMAMDALRTQTTSESDIHLDGKKVVVDLYCPVGDAARGFVLYFQIDTQRLFLSPMPSQRQRSSREMLLVSHDGDHVAVISGVTDGQQPLPSQVLLSDQRLLEVQAVEGRTGFLQAIDHRGIQVTGFIAKVPGTNWWLISKTDSSEVFKPIRVLAVEVLGVRLLIVLVAIVLIGWEYWRQSQRAADELWIREQHRQRINQELQRTQLILATAVEGFIIIDTTGRICETNEAYAGMVGYSPKELIGMRVHDLNASLSTESVDARLRQTVFDGGTRFETKHFHRNGSVKDVEIRANYLKTGDKEQICCSIRDITDRKRLEAEYRQAQKMKAVRRLAGELAHDFNNILMIILGNAALALSEPGCPEIIRTKWEAVQSAGRRAATIVRQLLMFSKKESGQRKAVNLNEVVSSVERMVSRLIGEDIQLEMHLQPDLPATRVAPGQIEQVLINLCINAREAMPPGGKLRITTETVASDQLPQSVKAAERYVLLSVVDNGKGMSDEIKAHLFEPFFTTKEPGKGTGLGMSIVYGIVKGSDGFIEVESKPGTGTTVRVYLPADEKTYHVFPKIGVNTETVTDHDPMLVGRVR
jgi:PAS domain S-box-containing protein